MLIIGCQISYQHGFDVATLPQFCGAKNTETNISEILCYFMFTQYMLYN